MNKIVKLILVCQAKDDKIPQLIPFNWILSGFIIIFCFLMLCFIYHIKNNEKSNIYNFYSENIFKKKESLINKNNYLW